MCLYGKEIRLAEVEYHKAHCRQVLGAAAAQITYDTELALPKSNVNQVMTIDAAQSASSGCSDHKFEFRLAHICHYLTAEQEKSD